MACGAVDKATGSNARGTGFESRWGKGADTGHGALGQASGSSAARSSQPDSTAPFAVRGIAFRTSLVVWYVSSVRARNSRAPPGHQSLPRPFPLWRSQDGSTKLQWVVVDEVERHRGEELLAARSVDAVTRGRWPYPVREDSRGASARAAHRSNRTYHVALRRWRGGSAALA